MEALGQHVQQEAPDELVRMKSHRLPAPRAVGAVVLPAERDAGVVGCNEAAVLRSCSFRSSSARRLRQTRDVDRSRATCDAQPDPFWVTPASPNSIRAERESAYSESGLERAAPGPMKF